LGIEVDKKLNEVKAKMIPVPKLVLGGSKCVESGRETNFQLFRDAIYENKYDINCGVFTSQNADVLSLV
jgi:hypothetical protein